MRRTAECSSSEESEAMENEALAKRSKYEPPPTRKSWSEKWRKERDMRDLAARLKMYRYGDGVLQVSKMC
jgi:hypothetical protein